MKNKTLYIKVTDDTVAPIIMPLEQALVYIGEILEGRTPNEPIKVESLEMSDEEYKKLPEFEG